MYKVGDKLLCRITFETSYIEFLNNCYYYILDIEYGNFIRIKVGHKKGYASDNECCVFYDFYLDKYFYTNQELRKLKLERLKK